MANPIRNSSTSGHQPASVGLHQTETYLTEAQFCERYHLRPRTVQRWRATGENGPPYVRLGAHRIAYRLSDCERWASGRVFNHRADELSRKAA